MFKFEVIAFLFLSLFNMTKAEDNGKTGRYKVHNVTFTSNGTKIIGRLIVPEQITKPSTTVTIIGPFGFVKEQSPLQYATRLAKEGFIALIFDPRTYGESDGLPRRYESPRRKIDDVKASIDFLQTRSEVDKNRIVALGICQGSSHMIAATSEDARIKVLATVSGSYIYKENYQGFYGNGGPTMDERITLGKTAKIKFDQTGQVDYTPVIDSVRKDVGLPYKPIYDWYHKWENISTWENRYTTMSNAELLTFDVDEYTRKLKAPFLIIHGDQSDGGPEAAKHIFNELQLSDKSLKIIPDTFHTRFYDDPVVIDGVIPDLVDWFKKHL